MNEPVSREEALEMESRGEVFVCYECKDDNCESCVGIPCMCPCPVTKKKEEPEYCI